METKVKIAKLVGELVVGLATAVLAVYGIANNISIPTEGGTVTQDQTDLLEEGTQA